ncbi:MAG TPA: sigma-70 family RNA polymerase sigma factor [Solirubrobacteraceae bacterium]|nr:sigma-70 family RNA polymerase sigma factor [Solirubrobacteraceae bacterium]
MPAGLATIEERELRTHEAQLLALVASGDPEEALGALYDTYAGDVYRLGLRLLSDPGQAEELVQETFVRLWRVAARYDPRRASVRGFTFMIAKRIATDFLRRAAARPQLVGGPEAALDAHVEDEVDRVVREFEVREALATLSRKHREVLELTFDEDLDDTRIAQRLDVPVGTVRSRTYYALRALRAALEERDRAA